MVLYGYSLSSLNRIIASEIYRIEIVNCSVLLAKEQHRHGDVVPVDGELASAMHRTGTPQEDFVTLAMRWHLRLTASFSNKAERLSIGHVVDLHHLLLGRF